MKSTATIHTIKDAATPGLVMTADSSLPPQSVLDEVANAAYYRSDTSGFSAGPHRDDGLIAFHRPGRESAGCEPVHSAAAAMRTGIVSKLVAAEARIVALEAALRNVSRLASHDPLTGACNRRGMSEVFSRESARAQRTCRPLALALVDLDDFKYVNDRYGHAVGDAALVFLTRAIGETLRPTDTCCRLGGEEFVVIMPDADHVDARQALLRLQTVLDEQPIADTSMTLAFSAGVVLVRNGESLDHGLGRADCAVYRAKAEGKRRIVSG